MGDRDIFDLDTKELLPFASAACNENVKDLSVHLDDLSNNGGICGEYLYPTFKVTTESGRSAEIPLFVRRQLQKAVGNRQGHHYRFLASKSVAAPYFYGATLDAADREIIFLERIIPARGKDSDLLNDVSYLRSFLRLIAAFNAARPSIDYIGDVGRDLAARKDVQNWDVWLPWSVHILSRIEASSQSGKLGAQMMDYCCRNASSLALLKNVAASLQTAIRRQPLGLVHGDFRPGNTGQRATDQQLVVFDFEDIKIDSRFYDVAQILGGPKPLLRGTKSNNDLIEYFLENFVEMTGQTIDFQVFLNEIRIAWAARKVDLWEYLPPEVGGPPYEHRAFIAGIQERQSALLETLCQLVGGVRDLSLVLENAL